ncbi:MAG: hypothetical protein HY901_08325 [Deltaproteobacteria bacterium]|nr:hypothetical protein [Deltaproteobacteria bacterium]
MGKFAFGASESLTCIQNVPAKGPDGESLCLAFKTTTQHVFAGVYLTDDGYVLKIQGKDAYLPLPEEPVLSQLQQEGSLPNPLPPYTIPTWDYVGGYLLWLVIGATIVVGLIKRSFQRRRKEKEDATSVSLGPPKLKTRCDHFVAEEVAKVLLPGEAVQHQAYTLDRETSSMASAATAKAHFAVLTNRRALFFKTRVGAFAPIQENLGMEELAREDISSATADLDGVITLTLTDGSKRSLVVPRSERHLSNQRAFLRDVPRLVGAAPAQQPLARSA